jgi:hypothetical protein
MDLGVAGMLKREHELELAVDALHICRRHERDLAEGLSSGGVG